MKRTICLVLGLFLLMGAGTAWGHSYNYNFDKTGSYDPISIGWIGYSETGETWEHSDEADGQGNWGGWTTITVTNMGQEAWGDFHFGIYYAGQDVTNVDFYAGDGFAPTYSGGALDSFTIDNDGTGFFAASINLYFDSNPVGIGETATFSVYNLNPDMVTFFGTAVYPTPVGSTPIPVPGAVWLLGSALAGVIGLKHRKS